MDLSVDYDHELNRDIHTVSGASEVLRIVFPDAMPGSILDVGCGAGTWLRAVQDRGVTDVFGVDGVSLDPARLHVDKALVRQVDLNQPLDLGRKFDLVINLEVAEHLEPASAVTIVETLCRHGDRILFSAAAPGQGGTHHVNCQWPTYWQDLFNAHGFAVADDVRWRIWGNQAIEPWYRQNLMIATRDPALAGKEKRIIAVVHPDMMSCYAGMFFDGHRQMIEQGAVAWPWYLTAPVKAATAKVKARLAR